MIEILELNVTGSLEKLGQASVQGRKFKSPLESGVRAPGTLPHSATTVSGSVVTRPLSARQSRPDTHRLRVASIRQAFQRKSSNLRLTVKLIVETFS